MFFKGADSNAQIISGAAWTFAIEQTSPAEATLVLTANIKEKFHIYSQHLTSSDGPLPTVFEFTPSKNFELVGKTQEEKGHEIFDEAFQMKLLTFEGVTAFRQKIKILTKEKFEITGKLSFMACDNRMCVPPEEVPYTFNLNNK
ncbi:MAG: sugar transporter [Bacteroidetes bacterium]|nr:sugar transporter [Bacteroidota bacterium]